MDAIAINILPVLLILLNIGVLYLGVKVVLSILSIAKSVRRIADKLDPPA